MGGDLVTFSAVVELGAHEPQPALRDSIRPAVLGGDGLLSLDFTKEPHIEAGKVPAVTRYAVELGYPAALVLLDIDAAPLCENVEDALFRA